MDAKAFSLFTGAVLAVSACLVFAPPVNAACSLMESDCDMKWTATQSEFLATPRVVGATGRVTAFATVPFVGTVTYSYADGAETVVERVFSRDGVSRFSVRQDSGPTSISYLTAARFCNRKVSKRYPNTFQADARAKWACRARTSDDRDAADWIAGLTPAAVLAAHPSLTWFADITAPRTDGAVDSALTILMQDLSHLEFDWVILPRKMLLDENGWDTVYWMERATIVDTQGVPELPKVRGLGN